MGELIYITPMSLDGFLADESGSPEWSAPDEEVHSFINDRERPFGTHIYGRKMYETMAVWETMDLDEQPSAVADYAEIWRAAEKIVFSKTLETVTTARTTLKRDFDPVEIARMKETAGRDLAIGGPHLAATAIRAGLVDEYQLFVVPAMIGKGNTVLPTDVQIDLELVDEKRFDSGWVYLRYRPATPR